MKNRLAIFALVFCLFATAVVIARVTHGESHRTTYSVTGVEYAQLIIQGDPLFRPNAARVLWNEGDRNLTPDFVSISSLDRLLSRKANLPTLANLLNSIGAEGWELVTVTAEDNQTRVWTFQRDL